MTETRYLPFNDIRELHRKCSNIIQVMDMEQQKRKERLVAAGIEFTELKPFGFAFDMAKVEYSKLKIVLGNEDLIEIFLIKEGVKPLETQSQ